jgi:metal-responsive CopG/Arc/MetJ family transcriptional regulator
MFHSMRTIQVVLEEELLRAADRAARRLKVNRSMLVREALRAHLAALARRAREEADRAGYERVPAEREAVWEKAATWPEEWSGATFVCTAFRHPTSSGPCSS